MSKEELLQRVLELPAEDRIELIDLVERSLGGSDVDLLRRDPELVALLNARLTDPAPGIPWEEAKRQIALSSRGQAGSAR